MNAHAALILPLIIVWRYIEKPAVGGILLLHATITWMKLISYFLANEDLRANASDDRSSNSMLGIVEDLDPSEADRRYPENITLSNIFYFWLCPSLTYQIAFPKSPSVRLWKIAGILLRMIVCLSLFVFVTVQIVTPALADVVQDLKATGGKYTASMLADYWLRLSIANTYLWLLMFYFYFHLYLNLFAEILRFGDRVFYKGE
jgi:diacylglycerol O-acyltransferase 1